MKTDKAFTLVELVVTIAVIVILSTISVPIYKGYVGKTMYAEGYSLLGRIRDAQLLYHAEYGYFLQNTHSSAKSANYTCNEEVTGINARSNKYFTLFRIGYYNWHTNEQYKTSFAACVVKPPKLTKGNLSIIEMVYSLTTGVSFSELSSSNL